MDDDYKVGQSYSVTQIDRSSFWIIDACVKSNRRNDYEMAELLAVQNAVAGVRMALLTRWVRCHESA